MLFSEREALITVIYLTDALFQSSSHPGGQTIITVEVATSVGLQLNQVVLSWTGRWGRADDQCFFSESAFRSRSQYRFSLLYAVDASVMGMI